MTRIIFLQLFRVVGTSLGLTTPTDGVEVGVYVWLHGAVDVIPDSVVYIPVCSQTHHVAVDAAGLPLKKVPPMLRLYAGVLTVAFTCRAGNIRAAGTCGCRTASCTSRGEIRRKLSIWTGCCAILLALSSTFPGNCFFAFQTSSKISPTPVGFRVFVLVIPISMDAVSIALITGRSKR